MNYRDFFDQIRDILKDVDTDATASIPSAELGRYVLKGVRALQSAFPETRLDSRGNMRALETTAYTETTADVQTSGQYPAIPLPAEYEPAWPLDSVKLEPLSSVKPLAEASQLLDSVRP